MNIFIDGKKIKAVPGQTVLEVAKENGIEIPGLCHHPDLDIKAGCRMCLVEIKGKKELQTSCSTKAKEGMEIISNSPRINKARKINLELIFSHHKEECWKCALKYDCYLLDLAHKYKASINLFKDRKTNYPACFFGPSVVFDSSKCIDCRNCIDVCHKQAVDFMELKEKDGFFQVVPSEDKNKDCVYCGQCIVHCPVGALEAVGDSDKVEKALKDKSIKVVFQFAPSIRTSIGEEFNLPYGRIVTDKLVAGMKKLGAFKVFDTSVGADFTTIEEAKELLEKKGACLSSCCPAWVKFVEFNYPEFISCLATTRSPQAILGGIIKSYWAKKEGIDARKVMVVSVMPCVAKKYEVQRKELEIDGLKPVDWILTTRELACLFKKNRINLEKIIPCKADDPLGNPSGAGVIYGASGGVLESALRTAFNLATGKNPANLDFKSVRGAEGIKKAEIKIGGKLIKAVSVNGLGNAKKIMEELKKDPKKYDAVEVMACFGGCIGGGGQPMPVDGKIRKARAESLYAIDAKKKLRMAHENPAIKKVYEEFLNNQSIIHKICHTKYSAKKKEYVPGKNCIN